MNREYHKWFSQRLNRDMELLLFGHHGLPVLVFPTSMGKFYEYEDRGMTASLTEPLEAGRLMLVCVDSVDGESWYNKGAHPWERVQRHAAYESYVLHEALPFLRQRSGWDRVGVSGCSFGGFHCVNFALRHPEAVSHCVAMSGAFDIHSFLDGFYNEDCYFNCPVDYLPNLADSWQLDRMREIRWIFGAGEHDICLAENRRISSIFHAKGIPHWFDLWGLGAHHDWPLWQLMARKYFGGS